MFPDSIKRAQSRAMLVCWNRLRENSLNVQGFLSGGSEEQMCLKTGGLFLARVSVGTAFYHGCHISC